MEWAAGWIAIGETCHFMLGFCSTESVSRGRFVLMINGKFQTLGVQMMTKITIADFLPAFSDQWNNEMSERQEQISELYAGPPKLWTNFILGDAGLIQNVIMRINSKLKRKPEWWRIDLAYLSGGDLASERSGYDLDLQLLVEHENGDFPEEEMYNLIFFRSPLKVIIFRDYNGDDRNGKGKDWCKNKLNEFMEMLNAANSFHSENSTTQYLFIVWARKSKDDPVYWRWASNQFIDLKDWKQDWTKP